MYKLLKGEIEEFAIIDENIPEDLNLLYINNAMNVKIIFLDKILSLENTIKYETDEKELLKLKSILLFKIDNTWWDHNFKENKIIFNKEILQEMGALAVGASRGILIAKTTNSPFSRLILPPMKIEDLLYEDITFEFKQN